MDSDNQIIIYQGEDGELDEHSVVRNFRTTAADGKSYNVTFYNLDMIISLGYRIRSVIAMHFRRWDTERLEYIIKGFTMDDEQLKGNGGGAYWRESLDHPRHSFVGEGDVPSGTRPLCYRS